MNTAFAQVKATQLATSRVQPHSLDAEEYLLSCCFIDGKDVLARCLEEKITPEMFYAPANNIIYKHLLNIYNRGDSVEVAMIAEDLKAANRLNEIGGYGYLVQVSARIPTTAQVTYFIEKVREQYQLREIIKSASLAIEQCYTYSGGGIHELALSASDRFSSIISLGSSGLNPVSAAMSCAKPAPTPPILLDGCLYIGGTMLMSGASKSRKSWTFIDAGISIASGSDWLGFKTTKTNVLYLNLELPQHVMEKRIAEICVARDIPPPEGLLILHLRGKVVTITQLEASLPDLIKRKQIGTIIIDPHYKISATSGFEENSNDGQGELLARLEALSSGNNAALMIAHHFAKGDASAKDSIDRASGGGVFARWPDMVMTMTEHEEESCMTMEFHLRAFAPVPARVVRWAHPRWDDRDTKRLDPAKLKKKGKPTTHTAEKLLETLGDGGLTYNEWMDKSGMAPTTFKRRLRELCESNKIAQISALYYAQK